MATISTRGKTLAVATDGKLLATAEGPAGVRVFDISDAYHPAEVAALVPPAPEVLMDHRPGALQVLNSNDVFVDANRVLYVTDMNAGLYTMEMTI